VDPPARAEAGSAGPFPASTLTRIEDAAADPVDIAGSALFVAETWAERTASERT
jgi:hypothetical protein